MLTTLAQDLRYALRGLRKNPVFTVVATAVIAVGIAAVSTIYTVADAVILRPVPGVSAPGQMVDIERVSDARSVSGSYPWFHAIAAESRTMSGIAAWDMVSLTISPRDQGIAAQGNIVSGNYFNVLGVRPVVGRFFVPGEDSIPGARPVIVLSHAFWQEHLGGDSAVVGRSLIVNGHLFTVIGVAPARFSGLFPVARIDAWVPMMMQQVVRGGEDLLNSPSSGWLRVVGRLRPGVSRETARAELTTLTARFAAAVEAPLMKGSPPFGGVRLSTITGFPSDVAGPVLAFFAVLLALALLVLLIASVNVAGMLLVRALARRREIAVRLALGAARGRLIRQLLTESLLLFVVGGSIGLLLASVGTALLARIPLPREAVLNLDLSLDPRIVELTLVVALLNGAIVGMLPAFRASRTDLSHTLRSDTAGAGRIRSRLRSGLVAGQLSASLLLLTAAGLFVKALARGESVRPGYDVDHIATAAMDVSLSGYDSLRAKAFTQQLTARIARIPGVTHVAWTRMLPLSMSSWDNGIEVPGYTQPGGHGDELDVGVAAVDTGYFATIHLPIVAGRGFNASDDAGAPKVAVISRAFANTAWPGENPLGKIFKSGGNVTTVVGVVPDVKFSSLSEATHPFLYQPLAQDWMSGLVAMVRTSGDAERLAAPIAAAMHQIDPILPPPVTSTLERTAASVLLPQRVAMMITTALGLAGLVLATIGLYGIVAFSAAQRTREMGIRQALGATQRQVVQLVVGEGMRIVAVGGVIGLVLSVAAAQALTPFLFGVSPHDVVPLLAGTVVLAFAALAASWIPARRAARSDPMVSLRTE